MGANLGDTLLGIIKRDDLKAFKGCMENIPCGQLRYGRFPMLSVMYLYNAKKLIKAYEKQFITITANRNLGEHNEVATLFRKRAGKCLRYYADTVVSPPEMLLILDRTKKLKRLCPSLSLSDGEKRRMRGVYFTRYALSLGFDGGRLTVERRPLNAEEKRNIMMICASVLIALGAAAAVPFIVNRFSPFITDGTGAYSAYSVNAIDFASDRVYKLKKNVTVPADYYTDKFNCTLIGEGHTLTLRGGKTPFGELNGSISDVTVSTDGLCPLFAAIGTYGMAEGVTLNVKLAGGIGGYAFFAGENLGTVENLNATYTGSAGFIADGKGEINFGGIVGTNVGRLLTGLGMEYGEIRGCTVTFDELELTGESEAHASLAGISAINNGIISGCNVNGKVLADTVDVGGLCISNNYSIIDCGSSADIYARSQAESWSPEAAGIALINSGSITGCTNTGVVSASSLKETSAIAAGIAGYAYGTVDKCVNEGKVYAQSGGSGYAGGISSIAVIDVNYCISRGDVVSYAKNAYAGGVIAYANVVQQTRYIYFPIAKNCIAEGEIEVRSGENGFCGGIVGYVNEGGIYVGTERETYYGGGANYCCFTGRLDVGLNDKAGGICGAAGLHVYTKNSCPAEKETRVNFEGNLVANSARNAVGATYEYDGDGNRTFTVGGNKGAEMMDRQAIENSDCYKDIFEKVGVSD